MEVELAGAPDHENQVPSEVVFPRGALCLGVEPVRDFDAKGSDNQARDKETGKRLWQVLVVDLDPRVGRFGSTKEIKVKMRLMKRQPCRRRQYRAIRRSLRLRRSR